MPEEYNSSPAVKPGQPKDLTGWLLLLIFLIIIVNPVLTILGAVVVFSAESMPRSSLAITGFNLALACFGVYAGIKLLKFRRDAVKTAKTFLLWVFAFNAVLLALTLVAEHRQNVSMDDSVSAEIRNVVFALFWWVYIYSSKRVTSAYELEPRTEHRGHSGEM